MDYQTTCNGPCTVPQIVNINIPINDLSDLHIYNDCGCEYDTSSLQVAYSTDGTTWSCYIPYKEALINTVDINQDFYVRFKIQGVITEIKLGDEQITDYSTSIEGCFNFTASDTSNSSTTYNPYANMDSAVSLAQQLSESVASMVGIPCYYIKLCPDQGSKDLTFKEYTLMNVQDIKQVKLVIADNTMPSSKPEFNEWGLDWEAEWEVEVTKGSFATAFGNTVQPMEGDLVYIPMMKRMWMVNGAYEEKRDGFMWIATTFKLALVKYQEKDSVDLGDAQTFVDSLVKNKYEDLFGEDNNTTVDSNEATLSSPQYTDNNNIYNVFESDAIRKYITLDSLNINENSVYFKGILVSDSKYEFLRNNVVSRINYQNQYCGESLSMSFLIFSTLIPEFEGPIITLGNIKVMIKQDLQKSIIYLNIDKNIQIEIPHNIWIFIIIKWSKDLNICDISAYQYKHADVPLYKLQKQHYFFDIDNPISQKSGKYNIEFVIKNKSNIELNNFNGSITNFKLFDLYNDNISEMLQMYPNNQHLIINDTARKIINNQGIKI